MPFLFVGHGSPQNIVENNSITQTWKKLAPELGNPKAILIISAHWLSEKLLVHAAKTPKIIYDFYGFPEELYSYHYSAQGDPELAQTIVQKLPECSIDHEWGLDHGAWVPMAHIYPKGNVPMLQLSIPRHWTFEQYVKLGEKLRYLREQNILIVGSGNIVHNLSLINWKLKIGAYDWAEPFDRKVIDSVLKKDVNTLLTLPTSSREGKLSVPTTEHYIPLLILCGLFDENDQTKVFNQVYQLGSLSMTSFLIRQTSPT